MALTLAERVKKRVLELYAQGRFQQNEVTETLGWGPSALHGYIRGNTPITLDVLEAVSQLSGEPVAEIVKATGSEIKELNAAEAAIFRALRQWPPEVREALRAFVVFFGNEPMAEQTARNLHETVRHLSAADRQLLYALALQLRGRALSPELRESITDLILTARPRGRGRT